jgi:hypothetical protein
VVVGGISVGGTSVGETAVSTTSAAGDEQAAKNNINKARPSTVCFLNIVSNITISPFYSFGFANLFMRGG